MPCKNLLCCVNIEAVNNGIHATKGRVMFNVNDHDFNVPTRSVSEVNYACSHIRMIKKIFHTVAHFL